MINLARQVVAIDLDGTLLDTESEICAAVNDTLVHFGRAALGAAHIVALTGKGAKVLIEQALQQAPSSQVQGVNHAQTTATLLDEALSRFKQSYRRVLGTQATVYPGVIEGLELLKSIQKPMVCVTNKPALEAQQLLHHFKLHDYFQALVAPDVPDQRKPSAYLLLKAARLLAVQPQQMVLVGDSNNDVLAARRAGTAIVRVATGYERHLADKLAADIDCPGFLQAAQVITYGLQERLPANDPLT